MTVLKFPVRPVRVSLSCGRDDRVSAIIAARWARHRSSGVRMETTVVVVVVSCGGVGWWGYLVAIVGGGEGSYHGDDGGW